MTPSRRVDPVTARRLRLLALAAAGGVRPTLTAVATATGVDRGTLRDLVAGARVPSPRTVQRIAVGFGVPESFVLAAVRGAVR